MGVGFVAVLIVTAIVLILAARAWTSVAPTAQQIMKPGTGAVPDHGDKKAAAAATSGDLPDLEEMKKRTDRHAAEVKEASDKSN